MVLFLIIAFPNFPRVSLTHSVKVSSVFSSQCYKAYSPCVKCSIFLDQSKVLSSILLWKSFQYQGQWIHPALKGVKRENYWKDVLINLGALFPTWTFSLIYNGKDRMQWKIKTVQNIIAPWKDDPKCICVLMPCGYSYTKSNTNFYTRAILFQGRI